MRTIKFRCWDKIKKEIFFPSSIYFKNGIVWVNDVHGDNRHEYEMIRGNTEVMQFTGLCDRDYKEIYEGDIVHCYLEDGGAYQDLGNNIVKYDDCAFRAIYCLAELSPIIVVGNIYQNPELWRLI